LTLVQNLFILAITHGDHIFAKIGSGNVYPYTSIFQHVVNQSDMLEDISDVVVEKCSHKAVPLVLMGFVSVEEITHSQRVDLFTGG